MAVYRITRFASSDMEKVGEMTETMRTELEGVGADFIDLVSYGNGKGVVVARYPDQVALKNATEIAKQAFTKMIDAGVIDEGSVHVHTGDVFNSF